MSQPTIQEILDYLSEKAKTYAVFTFEKSLEIVQQAVWGVVGSLTVQSGVFNPSTVEDAALAYLETFYVSVLRPIQIANLPAGIFLEPAIHHLYTSVAKSMIHSAVALVLRTQAVGVEYVGIEGSPIINLSVSNQFIEMSQL